MPNFIIQLAESAPMDQLLQFAGRLHPLVLHAPIGFAVALVLLEVLFVMRRKPMPRDIRVPLAWLTALAAATAVASGLVLHEEGGYNADTVWLHQWLSIAVGACCLFAAVAQQMKKTRAYSLALGAAVVILIPAGHFGATMTHGENFLFEPFGEVKEPQLALVTQAPAGMSEYAGVIAPILQARCAGCHGADRDKGGLRLHTPEAILAGGEMGPVVVAGNAEGSDLFRRMSLGIEDEDHMPPKSKPQPGAEEVAAIKAWIAGGAKFDGAAATASGAPVTPNVVANAAPPPPPTPDPAALAAIRGKLAHVEPVARGSHLLLIDFSAVAPTIDDAAVAALLTPIKEHVADLNLSRTQISDEALTFIAGLPKLRRLNLSSTAVTEHGLGALANHSVLAELILTQTKLTDSAFDTLVAMPALTNLYLWKSGITPETIGELRAELPKVVVDAGDTSDAVALEAETEVKFTNAAAPPPAGTPAPSAADLLKPVNTICPVAGTPIVEGFAIVYKGKVVGFCCRHCIGKFLEEPEKYEGKIQ